MEEREKGKLELVGGGNPRVRLSAHGPRGSGARGGGWALGHEVTSIFRGARSGATSICTYEFENRVPISIQNHPCTELAVSEWDPILRSSPRIRSLHTTSPFIRRTTVASS